MREMNLNQTAFGNNRARMKIIQTKASTKMRPEDEMIVLMGNARKRFKKSIASGKLEIISDREWKLR